MCLNKHAAKRLRIEKENMAHTKHKLGSIPVLSIKVSLQELDGFKKKCIVIFSSNAVRRKALPKA